VKLPLPDRVRRDKLKLRLRDRVAVNSDDCVAECEA